MNWWDSFLYSDIVVAKQFEGIAMKVKWTPEQLNRMNLYQNTALTRPFTKPALKLFISKLLFKPIQEMNALMAGNTTLDDEHIPAYRLYSAHDTQIANLLNQLTPSYNYTGIPYSSHIAFELYRQIISNSTLSQYKHSVKATYNNEPMQLTNCGSGEVCSSQNFINGTNTILFVLPDPDLKKICDVKPTNEDIWGIAYFKNFI